MFQVPERLEHDADQKMMNFIENPEKIRRLKKGAGANRQPG